MKRMPKTIFFTLAAMVCLLSAGPVARADDSSSGVISDWLLFSGGLSNAASNSSGIIATNGSALLVSDLNLGSFAGGETIGADTIMNSADGIDFSSGSILMFSAGTLPLLTNGFIIITSLDPNGGNGALAESGAITAQGVPEPATWFLTGLGLLLVLRTHTSRRPSA